ncbi:MAG: PQQ-dependent sugar dehydrogenase, partial [Limisphaerales bacterium]
MKLTVLFFFLLSLAIEISRAAERVPWTTSRVLGSPEKPYEFKLERRFSALSFTNPVDLAYSRELKRWLLGEQGGKLFSFDESGQKLTLVADFAALQGREGSFYALTLDPNFATNAFLYVCYAQKPDLPDGSRV